MPTGRSLHECGNYSNYSGFPAQTWLRFSMIRRRCSFGSLYSCALLVLLSAFRNSPGSTSKDNGLDNGFENIDRGLTHEAGTNINSAWSNYGSMFTAGRDASQDMGLKPTKFHRQLSARRTAPNLGYCNSRWLILKKTPEHTILYRYIWIYPGCCWGGS